MGLYLPNAQAAVAEAGGEVVVLFVTFFWLVAGHNEALGAIEGIRVLNFHFFLINLKRSETQLTGFWGFGVLDSGLTINK